MRYSKRSGVFETNSSSVHSLVIVTEEDFEAFKSGKKVIDYNDKLVDYTPVSEDIVQEDAEKQYNKAKQSFWKDWKDLSDEDKVPYVLESRRRLSYLDEDMKTYEEYGSDYETFEDHFTTPSGDKMIAFGYYGYG